MSIINLNIKDFKDKFDNTCELLDGLKLKINNSLGDFKTVDSFWNSELANGFIDTVKSDELSYNELINTIDKYREAINEFYENVKTFMIKYFGVADFSAIKFNSEYIDTSLSHLDTASREISGAKYRYRQLPGLVRDQNVFR